MFKRVTAEWRRYERGQALGGFRRRYFPFARVLASAKLGRAEPKRLPPY